MNYNHLYNKYIISNLRSSVKSTTAAAFSRQTQHLDISTIYRYIKQRPSATRNSRLLTGQVSDTASRHTRDRLVLCLTTYNLTASGDKTWLSLTHTSAVVITCTEYTVSYHTTTRYSMLPVNTQ